MNTLVLAVPDGAAEPLAAAPTSLELARTPALDALAREGALHRVVTIPEGLPAGTEVGLPTLLGVALTVAPARGRIEAAAAGVAVGPDEGAWRLDVLRSHPTGGAAPPEEVTDDDVRGLDRALGQLGGRVTRLRGHRLLLVGPAWWGDGPPGPHQTERPLRAFSFGPFGGVAKAAKAALRAGGDLRLAWPWGVLGDGGWPDLPGLLRRPVLVVARTGAAVGIARLLGCEVAADLPDPLPDGALVVVHDPGPDEAGHARDQAAKVAAIERFDTLVADLRTLGADLAVCPDHGCDPATGRHDGAPVPALVTAPGGSGGRFTERAAAAADLLTQPGALVALLDGRVRR